MLSLHFIALLGCVGKMVVSEEKVCSAFCSSLGTDSSSPGKSCADIYQVNKASRGRSGYYWINNTSPVKVYCDMELKCGGVKGGWTKIANLDMSQGDSCPSPWSSIVMPGTSAKVCWSPNNAGCYSVIYPTYGISYDKICGRVEGYQKGTADAFGANRRSINDVYVDGISIALGSPRKHVWAYAVGPSDDYNYPLSNYPCAHIPGPEPPLFVGEHYYCESGVIGMVNLNTIYDSDALWDGSNCHGSRNNCCTNPGSPWLFRQLAISVSGYYLEVRNCHSEPFSNEDTLIESLDFYIQ